LRAPRAGLAASLLLLAVSPVAAQTEPARGRWMGTLLERTFLRIDVLTVDLCLDAAAGARIEALTAGADRVAGAVADSVTRAVLESGQATARVVFRRDLTLSRFLESVAEDQGKAVSAGLLSDTASRAIRDALPGWFAPLRERGIFDGDQLVYAMGSDSIRSRYIGRDGSVLLDRMDTGRERRISVLATWLAPGASLRNGLLRSLERAAAPASGWERGGCEAHPASGREGQSDSKRPWKNRSLAGS